MDNSFDKCDGEPTLYIKESDGKLLIIVLYVDDLIFTGNDNLLIVDFKEVMKSEFEMTDLGLLRYFYLPSKVCSRYFGEVYYVEH